MSLKFNTPPAVTIFPHWSLPVGEFPFSISQDIVKREYLTRRPRGRIAGAQRWVAFVDSRIESKGTAVKSIGSRYTEHVSVSCTAKSYLVEKLNKSGSIGRKNHLTLLEGNPAFIQLLIAVVALPSLSALGAQASFTGALGPTVADHDPNTS